MAVQRFVLDTNQLDDADFGLDGPSGQSFILDSSQLDGTDVLDGSPFLTVATGSASLGGLVATATSSVTNLVSASASLGGLVSSGSATVINPATLSASLGGLVASAITAVAQDAVATANLGGLVATANSIPTPPEPTPDPTPSGGRQYAAPRRRNKIEPEPIVQPVIVEPKRRYAVTSAKLGGMSARGEATITFSILADDAEVLLLV